MAEHGYGASLSWDGVTVAGLKAINGIEISAEMIDVTTHQSSNSYKEFIPGLLEVSEVSIEGLFDYTDTTGQHAMLADANAKESKTGIITFPTSGATWTFTGYISNIKIGDADLSGGIPFTAAIKITGKPTFAVSASAGLTTPFFVVSDGAELSPNAANDVYDYVANMATGVSSVTVTPTATSGVIKVNGNIVASGVASSAITLGAADSVTIVTITVTESGKSPKTYTIRVVRAAAA